MGARAFGKTLPGREVRAGRSTDLPSVRAIPGKPRYLQAARKTADYFIRRIPESGLIPVDFEQPEVPAWEDCAAAAIAASGLIETCGTAG